MRWLTRQAAGAWILVMLSAGSASAAPLQPGRGRIHIPARARQLIVVSSPSLDPASHLATLRAYVRSGPDASWQLRFGPWPAEVGYSGLHNHRHEGDGSTPTGVYGLDSTLYGNRPRPRGLHFRYHQLVCGDWWDEDPYSPLYNRFVHVPCGTRPGFAAGSEALWTERVAYPYFAALRFNVDPVHAGAHAPGSAIFLHGWVGGPTAGCVAVRDARLLALLRWIRPARHPTVAIGTRAQLY
ncbi:MAG TPA: L,D-transpeptidase family protein [Solirubrobacteraceae bacterium]|nr:L,D-transpeptidase family protein [Solirubrobacteraceae bacterium]